MLNIKTSNCLSYFLTGSKRNKSGTDAAAGEGNENIVDEGDFLALEVGALQDNSDGCKTGFFPVLVGGIDNPPDTLKRPKKVLHSAHSQVISAAHNKLLGDNAGEKGCRNIPGILIRMLESKIPIEHAPNIDVGIEDILSGHRGLRPRPLPHSPPMPWLPLPGKEQGRSPSVWPLSLSWLLAGSGLF